MPATPAMSSAPVDPPLSSDERVVPVADHIKGPKPVAFVVLKAGAPLSADDVKTFALAHAPAYQHPRHVWFVDAIPLASTNKVDRATLKQWAAQRVAADAATGSNG